MTQSGSGSRLPSRPRGQLRRRDAAALAAPALLLLLLILVLARHFPALAPVRPPLRLASAARLLVDQGRDRGSPCASSASPPHDHEAVLLLAARLSRKVLHALADLTAEPCGGRDVFVALAPSTSGLDAPQPLPGLEGLLEYECVAGATVVAAAGDANATMMQREGWRGLMSDAVVRVYPQRPWWWRWTFLRRPWMALRYASGFVALDSDAFFGPDEGSFVTAPLPNVTALDVAALVFHSRRRYYRHAWFVEDDVSWQNHSDACALFERWRRSEQPEPMTREADSDLVTTKIAASVAEQPGWSWWPLARVQFAEQERYWAAGLHVVSRVSARLINEIAATRLKRGRFSFYELLWPITARERGMSIAWMEASDARALRCCDDWRNDEPELALGGAVIHPHKAERHRCEGDV